MTFTLDDIHRSTRQVLASAPDGVVAYRLLREVLHVHPDDPSLVTAKVAALSSQWVRQLQGSQLPDGSWGRFHTQDTKVKTVFRTTEEAIDRAFALGLEPTDTCLTNVRKYIENVLSGDAMITDWYEKNDAFPVLITFILAGRLAQIDPTNKMLDTYWTYLLEVANQAFSSGNYRLEDEKEAYLRLSGIHVPRGFLESQHALWILSSRELPSGLDRDLMDWIWNKPKGIGYLGAALSRPSPYHIGYWLRSMNIISRFGSWREMSADSMNDMWEKRHPDGWWDFGSEIAKSIDFPLSESWHQSIKRKMDYSTCILVLLRKYFN
ncbi:MAG: hypothetical protein A2Y88_09130 [Chloroflexi bacterium RBG_13_48_10]|nr:MAG: hypothetical protein A2Y88_09130 [Chloroflexi bacterium RBG_13_48_10]